MVKSILVSAKLGERKTLTMQLCSSIIPPSSPHNRYVWRAANRVFG